MEVAPVMNEKGLILGVQSFMAIVVLAESVMFLDCFFFIYCHLTLKLREMVWLQHMCRLYYNLHFHQLAGLSVLENSQILH